MGPWDMGFEAYNLDLLLCPLQLYRDVSKKLSPTSPIAVNYVVSSLPWWYVSSNCDLKGIFPSLYTFYLEFCHSDKQSTDIFTWGSNHLQDAPTLVTTVAMARFQPLNVNGTPHSDLGNGYKKVICANFMFYSELRMSRERRRGRCLCRSPCSYCGNCYKGKQQ